MNQYEKPPFAGATSPGPTGVDEIPPFTNKDVFSRRKHNQVLRVVNALRRLFINPPGAGRVLFSDHSVMLDLTPLIGGTGSGTGNMNYREAYDATQNYNFGDVVYVGSSPINRYFYVCELTNGPLSSVHAPDPTEQGSVFWRLIAQPSGAVTQLTFSSWGFGGDNDYITCSAQKVHLPPCLRPSITSHAGITFDTYDFTQQSRLAHGSGFQVTQFVTRRYIAGDIIFVSSVAGILQDMNADSRVFAGT